LFSLADHTAGVMRRVAQAGLTLQAFEHIRQITPPIAEVETFFQPRYRISGSYFLPAEDRGNWTKPGQVFVQSPLSTSSEGPRAWRENDLLLVPLRSPAGQLLGLMNVDNPRGGKRPTLQTVEALEIFANQAAFAIENYQLVQAYQAEAEATRRERDRLAQLHLVASEIQRMPDIPTRLQVVADGIRAAGWGRVAITLRDHNLEPRETITAGYSDEEAQRLKANLLPGIVWGQRLTDPDFRQYRGGQAYYIRDNDPLVTENKLMAGAPEAEPSEARPADVNAPWHPLDTVYLPLYGLDRSTLIGIISMDSPADGSAPTEASMRPIELFAAQASSTIENTRLYQETIRAAQQEARINEVMEAVSSTLEVNEIIKGIARGLQQMMAFTRMSVALLNRARTEFEGLRVNIDL